MRDAADWILRVVVKIGEGSELFAALHPLTNVSKVASLCGSNAGTPRHGAAAAKGKFSIGVPVNGERRAPTDIDSAKRWANPD